MAATRSSSMPGGSAEAMARPSKETTAAASSSGACASRSLSARSSRAARLRQVIGHAAPRRIADVGVEQPRTQSPSAGRARAEGRLETRQDHPGGQRSPAEIGLSRSARPAATPGRRGAPRAAASSAGHELAPGRTAWCSSRSRPEATAPAARGPGGRQRGRPRVVDHVEQRPGSRRVRRRRAPSAAPPGHRADHDVGPRPAAGLVPGRTVERRRRTAAAVGRRSSAASGRRT